MGLWDTAESRAPLGFGGVRGALHVEGTRTAYTIGNSFEGEMMLRSSLFKATQNQTENGLQV